LVLTASVLAPTAVAVALIPWRSRLDTADCALFLVVAIVAVASTGNRVAALVSAFVAALSFDFFLTRPYYSFRISRHQDLITELLLLVVGVAVGELAARGRAHQKAASESRKTVALLHSATESMATGQEPQAVIDHASAELMQLLSLRSCFFTRQHPVNISARITAQGEVMVGTQSWDTDDLGLPTSRVYLPVRAQGWLLGHFVLTPTQGRPVAAQQLLAAVAIADLVGAVLLADDSGSIPVNQGSLEDPADPEGKNLGAQHV
jgi:K+-sensing histidine kinase KdpD